MSDEKETDAPLPPITELHCAVCQFSTTDAKKYLDHIEHAHSIKPKREEAPAAPVTRDAPRQWIPCGVTWKTLVKEQGIDALVGLVVETECGNKFLIGDINVHRGACDCCVEFPDVTVIKNYMRVYP